MGDVIQFGRYEVRETIGRGAMGVVYLAEDPVIGRKVAIKVVEGVEGLEPDELEQLQARFEREFQSAGRLSHPNIVAVHDVGQQDGNAFIAMEFVAGESLHSILAQKRTFSFKEIADITAQLCSGLDYAHEFGIVHRDIKPANILIARDGRPKITDFGVAKVATTTLTRTGTVVGTPAYMSPEQVTGHPVTGAADQFSLAVMIYQMLTGERPFTGENPTTIMYKIVHEEALPPSVLNAMVPAAVDRALIRALSKNPEERYPTCMALADALRASLGAAPTDATVVMSTKQADVTIVDPSLTQRKRKPVPERKKGGRGIAAAVIAGFCVLAIAVAAIAYNLGWFDRTTAPAAGEPVAPAPNALIAHTLSIEAPEGWAVWIDGENVGIATTGVATPATVELSRLPDDEITVELRFEDTTLATTTFTMLDAPATWAPPDLDGSVAALAEPEEDAAGQPPAEPVLTPFTIRSTPPGATVTFDSEVLEQATPVEVGIDLSSDARHVIGLRLDGYDSVGLTFGAGDLDESQITERELNFPLTSAIPPGFVSIDNPSYAVVVTVTPSGGGTGRTFDASNRHQIRLAPGRYVVDLSAPSVYWVERRIVTVGSEQVVEITPPRAVTVQVGANPGNCVVSINGVEVGPPPFPQQIVAGTHTFSFDWGAIGGGVRNITVRVTRNGQQVFGTPEQIFEASEEVR